MIRSGYLYLVVLFWSVWPQFVRGQSATTPIFRVDHIGVSDGLTQGSVYYIHKDSRGFLWFGTQDGLNRYDGHHFHTYRPALTKDGIVQPGTIRGINIFGIVEDTDGNLWIGTEVGLNRYDRRHDRFDCFFVNGSKPGRSRLTSRTMPFSIDSTNLTYLSDAEGLVQFNYRTLRKTILAANLHPTREYDLQSSAVKTPSGDIWLHGTTGIQRYEPNTHKLSRYFSNHPHNLAGSAQAVSSFFIEDSIAWLGTHKGLIRLNYQNGTFQTYDLVGNHTISSIYSLASDNRGRLWLGTQQDGVLYFDKRSRLFGQVTDFLKATRQLNEFKISKVYVDNTGIVWANTDPDGMARIVPDAFLFGGSVKSQANDGLPANQKLTNYTIRGFLEERFDRLWVLTQAGINVLDPRTNLITERFFTSPLTGNGRPQIVPKCLYRDPQRRIWVGHIGGVLAFDSKSRTFTSIPFSSSTNLVSSNYVRNLTSISDSFLLAGTEDGLYVLNTVKRNWSKLPLLDGQNIFSIWYNTKAHQLWVGTYLNGYYCYQLSQPEAGKSLNWRFLRSGLKGFMILHIRPDASQQTIWLSCDRGLVALNAQTGRFRLYTEQQGLANSFVYGTISDVQQKIWMSTNRGISRLDPETQVIKNFTPKDGLQGYEFNGNAFMRAANGELYFGGVNGFNRFRPDAFRSSTFNPYVYIYSLTINEQPYRSETYVGETKEIRLDYSQNTLALEFAALDFFSNGHNSYQYQLTGYDDQWVMAGERNYVRYANLPPGSYTFQIKAANQDGHWSHRIRKLIIHIEPPFWKTIPFVLSLIVLLIVGVWIWVRRREDSIRQQQVDRLRLAYEIQEQVKKDIARDLHDEIGTRLATIKLYTNQLTKQAGETPKILSLKSTVNQLINDTISDVRNLLRKLNPQTLEQHGYVAAVDELFSRIGASGGIVAQFDGGDTLENANRLPTETEVMLYRITQELVSNSLKHASPRRIGLQLKPQQDQLVLVYQDDGSGFNYDQIRSKAPGLGMGNIESRVALLGGRISWESKPGFGVKVTIEIPTDPLSHQPIYKVLIKQPHAN
ncbi:MULTISPECIES: sensor histidine kinase [unclassified Spirosoma]|uniref:sensor histidine kinase n=1 Tax=unclassified Spirosoma TaxID=2621999 RepID=UPI000959E7E2|nr:MULTISPECIES: sensor histidine kinase [unclassified Spirosoma]MBN8823167.1 histidine kinase [Spirosoma sp.]OJW73251.1 MAG: histidine kinase [Spirosoma sp. 48-14]